MKMNGMSRGVTLNEHASLSMVFPIQCLSRAKTVIGKPCLGVLAIHAIWTLRKIAELR